MEFIRREIIYLWYYFTIQFSQVFPYWMIGMVLGSLISVFLKDRIHGLFLSMQGKRIGVFGIVAASALGIASPLCMYGTIPIAASVAKSGMRHDWLAAFMMSSILLNPQLIVYSAALGTMALVIRIVSCFLCGVVAGLLVKVFYKDRSFFNFTAFDEPTSHDTDPNLFLRFIRNFGRNIRATGLYFLLGIALSAVFQRYVPAEWIAGLSGDNQGFGILLAATIGVPLYACGGGTIPLLQQWLMDGMSMGSATAFMVTGPATKITNLGALEIVLGFRRFFLYLIFVISFALLSGFFVNLFV